MDDILEEGTRCHSLSFDDATWRRLQEYSAATGRSISQLVRIMTWNVESLADLEPKHAAARLREVLGV